MHEQFFDTNESLRDVVSYFYGAETPATVPDTIRCMVPNLETALVMNFGPPILVSFGDEPFGATAIKRFALIGPLRKRMNYALQAGSNFLAANFTLDGFHCLFQTAMDGLTGTELLNPDRLLRNRSFTVLWKKMSALGNDPAAKLALLQGQFQKMKTASKAVEDCLLQLHQSQTVVRNSVKAAARLGKVSERTTQLRFRKYFGYSEKERIANERFYNLMAYLFEQRGKELCWNRTAGKFGYYDQSHLIHDFKRYLNITPQAFLSQMQLFCLSNKANLESPFRRFVR